MKDSTKMRLFTEAAPYLNKATKMAKRIEALPKDQREQVLYSIGTIIGSRLLKRALRKRGADEATIYIASALLVRLAAIERQLTKLNEKPKVKKPQPQSISPLDLIGGGPR